ncbi:MAG: hypothetical protein ACMVY4_03715 [Minwuia sp.]|uniref:hypothetical protein n=1 Tax=Minwuia sp. TaxID=2493630 RepID=UPI003A89EC8E
MARRHSNPSRRALCVAVILLGWLCGAAHAAEAEREVPLQLIAIYRGFKTTCLAVIEGAKDQPFVPASDSIAYHVDADTRRMSLANKFILDYEDRHALYRVYPRFDFDQPPAEVAGAVSAFLEGPVTGIFLLNGRGALFDDLAERLGPEVGYRPLVGADSVYEGFLVAREGVMQVLVVNALDQQQRFGLYVVNVFHTALIGAEIYSTDLRYGLGEFRFGQLRRYQARTLETYYFARSLRDRLVPYGKRGDLYSPEAQVKIEDDRMHLSEFRNPRLPPYRQDIPESCADEFDWVSDYVKDR